MTTGESVQTAQEVRRWTTEEKLSIVKEFTDGASIQELCRKYGFQPATLYKWRQKFEVEAKVQEQSVPKTQLIALQKRVDELERALGRKAMEVDVLKKVFEAKGLKFPDGI